MSAVIESVNPQEEVTFKDGDMAVLPCSALLPTSWGNFRKTRSEVGFSSLLSSIKQQGVIQPIVVRPKSGAVSQFEVLAGYGRLQASVELGLPTIPCVVRLCDDKAAMGVMMAENEAREAMSPVDEAEAADTILSECRGDEKEAASMLGWTVFKLRQRMRLMRCPKDIRDMIGVKQDNGFTLTLAHADKLAAFPFDVQQKLIAVIVKDKWTVLDLQNRAQSGTRKLERACFDKGDCGQCQFNSDQQASLFSAPSAEALCSNVSCYNRKNQDHLEQQKVELEERYGKVLLWGAVNESHRRPLLEDALGSEQYKNGCMSCENRVAVLDDRAGSEGNVHENQCLDLNCYRQRVADFRAANNPAVAPTPAPSVDATSAQDKPAAMQSQQDEQAIEVAPPASAPVVAELPSRIVRDNDAVMRQAAANVLLGSDKFLLASMLACLCQTSNYTNRELGLSGTLESLMLAALSLTEQQIDTEIAAATRFLARESDLGYTDMVKLMKKAATTQPESDVKQATVDCWEMNAERLALYTKDMQVSMLEGSGFKAAYIESKGEGEYRKLLAMRTDEREQAILLFPFDWSNYAPPHLLSSWG